MQTIVLINLNVHICSRIDVSQLRLLIAAKKCRALRLPFITKFKSNNDRFNSPYCLRPGT